MGTRNESGAVRKTWHTQLRVALVYPNTYRIGMSNLGFQHVYNILNTSENFLAERFFLEPPTHQTKSTYQVLSEESSKTLRDFHVIAFSLPFENDYVNVPHLLKMGKIEPFARNRSSYDPLVMSGGISVSMNPEPVASFMDFFYIGEMCDLHLPNNLFNRLAELAHKFGPEFNREKVKEVLVDCPGVYVPQAYKFDYDDRGRIISVGVKDGYPSVVKAVKSDHKSCVIPKTLMTSPDAEFGQTCLVEINRGCSRMCRFCAAGWIHSPVRYRTMEKIRPVFENAQNSGLRIGLVGSDLAGHPQLEEMISSILLNDATFSLSSIRPEGLSQFMIDALAKTGQKTATIAPEVASGRLKAVIGKQIPSETFFQIIAKLVEAGIPNVRLYFMIGLPTETDEDVHDIIKFVLDCRKVFVDCSRKKRRIGCLSVQINPFIPKPWTPFQWSSVLDKRSLETRIDILRKGLKNVSNLSLRIEYGKEFFLQALLSRCDRRLGERLLKAGPSKKWSFSALRREGIDVDLTMFSQRSQDDIFPWDIVDHGIPKQVLWKVWTDSIKNSN